MVDRRELITLCRQIGAMMEVGVDFLVITRALRDQTDNPRLLELYDQLDHDMKMGENLADAISKAPDVFSPFAVSLVRQGEARGDIEGAWHRLADFLKQEAQEDKELGLDESGIGSGYIPTRGLPSSGLEVVAPRAPVTVGMLTDLIDRLQSALQRAITWTATFLMAMAIVWWSVELGFIAPRWIVGIQLLVAAGCLALAGSWLRVRREQGEKKQAVCSFCGKTESEDTTLQRSSRLAGAAICAACAGAVAGHPAVQPTAKPGASPSTWEAVVETHPFANLEKRAGEIEANARQRASSQGFVPSPTHEVTEEVADDENDDDPFKI
jgi:hypothetical protein